MRQVQHIILVITLSLFFASCVQNKYPTELEKCFEYLDEHLSDSMKTIIRDVSKDDSTSFNLHFSAGLFIRNNLLRHNEHSSEIVKYFYDNYVFHYDNMSGLILMSYNKYLNEEGLDELDLKSYYSESKKFYNKKKRNKSKLDSVF